MKTALDPRHLKRQEIVQELFAWQAQLQVKGSKLKVKSFADKTQKIINSQDEIDQIIKDAAPEWGIDKINQIDLAILRLAVYELCLEMTEPVKVVIDEAVELAKEFGGENSPVFINGALAKALFDKKRIFKIIAGKLGVEEEKLTPQSNLITDLNATELEISDLMTILEKELNLVPQPNLAQFKTVGNILEYIEEHNE